jgi:hypothetical protein
MCAALAGTALFGAVGFASAAHAAPSRPLGVTATVIGDDEVSTSASRAFWIENRTSERLTLARFEGAGEPLRADDSFPGDRVIEPGQTMRVEVTSGVFSNGGHGVHVGFKGDRVRWTPPQDVPAYYPGPEGECADRTGPVQDCHAYTLPPEPYFGTASVVLNVWGYTRTSYSEGSAFGPVLAGGEAIVITGT